MQTNAEQDRDRHERLGKLWRCFRNKHHQDSTWSWVVCISAAICNAINLGFVLSFGVLFPVLLDYFNETRERTGEQKESFFSSICLLYLENYPGRTCLFERLTQCLNLCIADAYFSQSFFLSLHFIAYPSESVVVIIFVINII